MHISAIPFCIYNAGEIVNLKNYKQKINEENAQKAYARKQISYLYFCTRMIRYLLVYIYCRLPLFKVWLWTMRWEWPNVTGCRWPTPLLEYNIWGCVSCIKRTAAVLWVSIFFHDSNLLLPTCKIMHVNMQHNYVHVRLIYASTQDNYVNMRDKYVEMQHILRCMLTLSSHVLT